MEEIKIGKYRHYKGKDYEVIALGKHTETLEELVFYRALYGDHLFWARPASMWLEEVEYEGKIVKRYTYLD